MIRAFVAFSSAVLACTFASLLVAQTETVIDGRDQTRTQPFHALSSGWSIARNPDTTLEAVFTITDPNLEAGSPVNYEMVITNTGAKAVTLPRTLDWKDVDTGGLKQQYVKANIDLELSTKDVLTDLMPTVILYSTKEKPSTALLLRPGDSVRLLGTSVLPVTVFSPNWTGKATLSAHFCERSVSVSVAPPGSPHKGTSTSGGDMWCADADQKYEVNFGER